MMSGITAVILAGLGLYAAAMASGRMPTDFALLLLLCTVVSGVYYVAELAVFKTRRSERAKRELAEFDRRNGEAGALASDPVARERRALAERLVARPWWVEYTAGFFPVIAAVFLLRSFLFEPFRIPSGSMIPTLRIGDLILVNKYQYGIRMPVWDRTLIPVGHPRRGDVVVFRFPLNPNEDFIKRVVGLPGDVIDYRDHVLQINGKVVPEAPMAPFFDASRLQTYRQYEETLGTVRHRVIWGGGDGIAAYPVPQHNDPGACVYSTDTDGGVRCTVPPNHYFVMGDNRDNSEDSRFWGFVPDRNLVGHAVFIWMNFGNVKRIGRFH